MNKIRKLPFIRLILAAVGAAGSFVVTAEAQDASATISAVKAGSDFDYTVTLYNTSIYNPAGATQLDSFWFGWTDTGDNLSAAPISAGNSLGWQNHLDGNSIQFIGNSSDALGAGQSATFTFVSPENPIAITTAPQGASVAYVNGIDFSQDVTGDSTPVFYTSLVFAPVPESTSPALLAVGCLGVVFMMRKKAGKLLLKGT
jgi:fermentation-respiration switch protein FrsA (DUF1100 family)